MAQKPQELLYDYDGTYARNVVSPKLDLRLESMQLETFEPLEFDLN